MSSVVAQQAESAREQAIGRLLETEKIREPTRRGISKISAACKKTLDEKGELSISNVIRVLKILFPGDHPAEQSVRNKTLAGACYCETIGIWRAYQMSSAGVKKVQLPAEGLEDFPDQLLNRIQPESARIHILAMRSALRNMRGRYQMLHSISPAKLIRHTASSAAPTDLPQLSELTAADREALSAFINVAEMASRGLSWDDIGRLLDRDGRPISRPGLHDCLNKLDTWVSGHLRTR
jgi:hypothetical protein